MRRALIILSLTSFACFAGTTRPTNHPAQPAEASAERAVPRDLRQLARAIEEIPAGYDDATHTKLVVALSLLSNVVRANDAETARRIDELATKLMRLPPYERGHADLASAVIGMALESFAKTQSLQPDAAIRDAYVAAQRALARISDASPLRFQLHNVAAAMRSVANIAALTRGLPVLFAQPSEEVQVAYDAAELKRRSIRLSGLVSKLASERSWEPASAKAAQALYGFADVLEVSPMTLDASRWRATVSAIRYEAMRLEREPDVSLDRVDHIKAGLAAIGWGALAPEQVSPAAEHLIAAAGTAIDQIDENTAFDFQRAVIQEAFRAAVDALVVIGHDRDMRARTASSAEQ